MQKRGHYFVACRKCFLNSDIYFVFQVSYILELIDLLEKLKTSNQPIMNQKRIILMYMMSKKKRRKSLQLPLPLKMSIPPPSPSLLISQCCPYLQEKHQIRRRENSPRGEIVQKGTNNSPPNGKMWQWRTVCPGGKIRLNNLTFNSLLFFRNSCTRTQFSSSCSPLSVVYILEGPGLETSPFHPIWMHLDFLFFLLDILAKEKDFPSPSFSHFHSEDFQATLPS